MDKIDNEVNDTNYNDKEKVEELPINNNTTEHFNLFGIKNYMDVLKIINKEMYL